MDINNVSQLITSFNNTQNNQNNQEPSAISAMPPAPVPTSGAVNDIYNPGEQPAAIQNFTPDRERISELWDRHMERVESFRQMVETLLNQQAERQGLADGWSIRDIEISPEMRAEASAMIDEGGYFSVEETAGRILDFAVALTGGDPAQIEVMRDAVQRGFDAAERFFGGELPEITHQTHAAVMNGFDEWAEAGSATAITLLNR